MKTIIAKKLQDLLTYYGVTQDQLADHLHTSRLTINQLCNGRRRMTADMALRLERYSGISAKTWLDLQAVIDLHYGRVKHLRLLKQIKPVREKSHAHVH